MKSVEGFEADDGTFFHSDWECEMYEAETKLNALCESHGVKHDSYKQMLVLSADESRRYLNAFQKYSANVEKEERQSTSDALIKEATERGDATPVSDAEQSVATDVNEGVQQLPFSRDEHVRSLGSSVESKVVSRTEPSVRVGGRKPNA